MLAASRVELEETGLIPEVRTSPGGFPTRFAA